MQVQALLVQDIKRNGAASSYDEIVGRALDQSILEHTQHMERKGGGRSHHASTLAMGTDHGRAFEHAGADALTRHLQQTEVGDAANLDARAVVFQRVLYASLDCAIVTRLLHIDEIDH